MNANIEYISAGIILSLILGVTAQYASSMVSNRVALIEKESGTEKVDKIIDTLLLSAGSPPDWGKGDEEPEVIGLAVANAIKLYQLDLSKVKRLNGSDLKYKVKELLGLSAEYDISFKIFPMLNIIVTKLSDEKFSVKVFNQWNAPVPNINITGAYTNDEINATAISLFMDGNLENAMYKYNVTGSLGSCTLHFAGAGVRSTMLVLARGLSVKSLTTWPTLSQDVIGVIESEASTSSMNVESAFRTVEVDGLNYIFLLKLWS